MNLFAALCVLAVATFLGYARSYAFSARVAALSAFIEEVPQLLLRMDYETLPLNRLAASLAGRETILAKFWSEFGRALSDQSAEDAWIAALAKRAPYGMTSADNSLMLGMGGALGAADADGRRKTAGHILLEATRQRDLLREDLTRRGSLHCTLGLMLGLAAAILVI